MIVWYQMILPARGTNPRAEVDSVLEVERDVRERLGGRPLDYSALAAIQNIYRAAAGVRRRAEREVLADHGLSWGGLTILWVLWVWGEMETARLAAECDLAKGTLTGMVTTLEKQGKVVRRRPKEDKRRTIVALTKDGKTTIDKLYPIFNGFETAMVNGLSEKEQNELARLLRIVIRNASDQDW